MSDLLYLRGLVDNYRSQRTDVAAALEVLDRHAASGKLTGPQTAQRDQLLKDKAYLDSEITTATRQLDAARARDFAAVDDFLRGSGESRLEGGASGMQTVDGTQVPARRDEPSVPLADRLNGRTSGDRDQAARTIDAAFRSQSLPDHAAEKATRLLDQGMPGERSLAARWATATGDPSYLSAFTKLVADSTRGHLLWDAREQAAYQRVAEVQSEMRAMSLTDTSGGFMVPLTLDPAILLTSAGSINPLRQIARVVQTAGDQWSGITSAGVTAEWKAEAAEAADASPTLANPNIPVHHGDAYVPFSFEVGMDGVNFLQELQKLLVDAVDQLQATAYTTGSGSGQPKGFVTALAGTASEINAAADDTFAKGDIYSLMNALPARFSPNASWMASLPIINTMSQFETTAGARLFPELSEGRLLNRPMHENSNMDSTVTTSGAVSNFVLAYGDWRECFVIADRIGATLEMLPLVVGTNRRPTGQRGAYLWHRSGSDVVNVNAARILDVASAA